ncbi:MAG: hypothetical protein M3R15_22650, partial [Acidobacteriota bacterium]|nr:hypothetical protein [Acidobacteriota bacterium]
ANGLHLTFETPQNSIPIRELLRREPAKLPNGRAADGIKAAAVRDGKTASGMNHAARLVNRWIASADLVQDIREEEVTNHRWTQIHTD